MKRKRMPHWIWPAFWGLKGKSKEKAIAEYYYEGEELDRKVAKIEHSGDRLKEKNLDIDLQYEKISRFEYDLAQTDFIKDKNERKLRQLEVKKEHNQINEIDYEKESALLNNEPWVNIVAVNFDEGNPQYGGFELDWNDAFIEMLHDAGYTEPTEEQTVNTWMNDLCKHIALEEFDGIGDFNEQLDERDRSSHVTTIKIDNERFSKE